jgi:peptidoglycan hydrolase CwlO-like protein
MKKLSFFEGGIKMHFPFWPITQIIGLMFLAIPIFVFIAICSAIGNRGRRYKKNMQSDFHQLQTDINQIKKDIADLRELVADIVIKLDDRIL